jgi:hypothetical protein
LNTITAQPLGITLIAKRATRHGFPRFGANRNIGKTNKYADKHHQEFDLAHLFASGAVLWQTQTKQEAFHALKNGYLSVDVISSI